jgi:hypothetical protein
MMLATTGLSVHHLYCYCKGEMVTALFRPAEPCKMAEKSSPGKNCCKGGTCCPEKQHNCTDYSSEFVKLEAKYLLPSFFAFKALEAVIPQAHSLRHFCWPAPSKNAPRWEQDLPPPPCGKQLLPWIQSYLC